MLLHSLGTEALLLVFVDGNLRLEFVIEGITLSEGPDLYLLVSWNLEKILLVLENGRKQP